MGYREWVRFEYFAFIKKTYHTAILKIIILAKKIAQESAVKGVYSAVTDPSIDFVSSSVDGNPF